MTPFDASALLAILLAFYQPATPANLARAFAERPEYFGGGSLIGHSGDALELPDGTVWDLIFNVDDPTQAHYQAIIPSGGGGAAADPLFTLEAGPLRPAPPGVLPMHPAGDVFQPIVADALGDLQAHDGTLASQFNQLADANQLGALADASGADVDGAGDALSNELDALGAAVPDDVLNNTDQHGATIPGHEGQYDEAPPGYAPTDTQPAPPPEVPDTQQGGGGTDTQGLTGGAGGGVIGSGSSGGGGQGGSGSSGGGSSGGDNQGSGGTETQT